MKKILIIIFCLFLITLFYFLKNINTFTIDAEFQELRPIQRKLSVYYKGIVVGYAKELRHSLDFCHTIVKLKIHSKNLRLPENTTVILKKEKRNNKERDFFELIYPKEPNEIFLSNNSKIKGVVASDMNDFLANQHPDEIEEIKENILKSAQNLNYALENLSLIFKTLDEILKENKGNIYKSTSNIEKTTSSTSNIAFDLEKNSSNIDNAMISTSQTMSNISAITCGIRKTLSKKFGGFRLFFGKVIE